LLKWTREAGERAYVGDFELPKEGKMSSWIRNQAAREGGEITPMTAVRLADMRGSDTGMAAHEIKKLLTYVNFSRPVEPDDVEHLSFFSSGSGDFFGLVDALASGNGNKAITLLRSTLSEEGSGSVYFRLVGHFRLLLLTREILENGGREDDVKRELSLHPFRAQKMFAQARTFNMRTLEAIYHRLLDYDVQIKTGQIEPDVALDLIVVSLTDRSS
jgi:DNA polymerase-3 subunit delta